MPRWVKNSLLTAEQQADQRSANRLKSRRRRARQRAREYPQPEAVEHVIELSPPPVINDGMTELEKAHARVEALPEYRAIIASIRQERAEKERQREEERAALHPFQPGRGVGWERKE